MTTMIDTALAGDRVSRRDLADEAAAHFGGTEAEGVYTPKDASDLLEVGINRLVMLNPERFNPRGDLAHVKAGVATLEGIIDKLPAQTRRTPEMEKFQQFSTPPHYAFAAAWAANLREDDSVLEPSAGVGGLACFALNARVPVVVNELSPRRVDHLRQFPFKAILTENAEQIHNLLPEEHAPSVVLMNPPFSASPRLESRQSIIGGLHVESALKTLKPGGRLIAILGEASAGASYAKWWARIGAEYKVVANLAVPGREYRRYGTRYDTRLVIIDKTPPEGKPRTDSVESIASLLDVLNEIRRRPTQLAVPTTPAPRPRSLDAVFETYQPAISFEHAQPHPTDLVESAAMASVSLPPLTYRPAIPHSLIRRGLLSDAQLEAIAYAGQAHQQTLPDGSRKGFMVGDGTGVGKGRILCGIILDAMNRG